MSCIRYLQDEGLKIVLTRKMSTDEIEQFHCSIRHHCGRNDHPDVLSALSAIEKIVRTGLARTSIACNVPLFLDKKAPQSSQAMNSSRNIAVQKIRAEEILQDMSK